VKGLVADANIQGQVEYLVQRMQAEVWADFWQSLGLCPKPYSGKSPPARGSGLIFSAGSIFRQSQGRRDSASYVLKGTSPLDWNREGMFW
jgi:hypothetical protein